MLKVLFITKDRSGQLEGSTNTLIQHLQEQCQLILWHEGGHIQQILTSIPDTPDFILLNDFHPDYCPRIFGLEALSIPKGVFFHDLHYKKFRRKEFALKNNIQVIFTHYRDAFLSNFPELASKMCWIPHFIQPEVMKDYGLNKHIDYLMLGATFRVIYPLRSKILHTLRGHSNFVHYPHPGYRYVGQNHSLSGVNYAKLINQSKIFFTCDSIYHYPVMKYFEVPACNSLLLAPTSQELMDLGFKDQVNFVAITEHNFLEKAHFYLKNDTLRSEIAQNGYHFVHKNHTISTRVDKMLSRILMEVKT